MKKIILCILIIVFFMSFPSYGEEPVLYDEVYVDNRADAGHFPDIPTALLNVKDGGTIYIGKTINIFSPFQINKSVKIESLNRQFYPLQINANISRVFHLNDISKFTLKNIFIRGYSVDVIEGIADEIIIQNSSFDSCNPINISGNSGYNILLEDNTFNRSKVNVQPIAGNNRITINNNIFSVPVGVQESLLFKNTNINASGNTFTRYSFILENGAEIEGNISENTFGAGTRILIRNQGHNVHFNKNKIQYSTTNVVTYNGNSNPDFRKNWWGSNDGPGQNMINGKIDYSNWALFDDLSRYHDDPYHLEDLEEACKRLGQGIVGINWLYNIKKDSQIDMLDLVGITRRIEKQ